MWAEAAEHTLWGMRKPLALAVGASVFGCTVLAVYQDPTGDHDLPDRIPTVVAYSSTASVASEFVVYAMDGSIVDVAPRRELRPRPSWFARSSRSEAAPVVDFAATYGIGRPKV